MIEETVTQVSETLGLQICCLLNATDYIKVSAPVVVCI